MSSSRMKIFVAGASSQRGVCHVLIQTLKHMGHKVHDWTTHPGYYDRSRYDQKQIKRDNLNALDLCDGLFWVTGNVSEGAGYEVGRAEALGKEVIIIDIENNPMLDQVYRQFSPVTSLDSAVSLLRSRLEIQERNARIDAEKDPAEYVDMGLKWIETVLKGTESTLSDDDRSRLLKARRDLNRCKNSLNGGGS